MKLSIPQLKSLIQDSTLDRRGVNVIGKCPKCGVDEFGVSIEDGHRFGCYREKSCGFRGNIFVLLKYLGKLSEFLSDENLYSRTEGSTKVEKKIVLQDKGLLDLSLPHTTLPIGYKRVYQNDYIDSRGWTKDDYIKNEVGVTPLDPKLRDNYVIIPVKENNDIKGYVARSRFTKEETKERKRQTGWEILRYQNSQSDFGKLLYGYEEITELTHTIILVEGIFDKVNVDRELELDSQQDMKCLASFKCDFSPEQIYKLQLFKNIKNIILFYDPDVISKIRTVATEIEDKFDKVTIAISTTEHDPGEMCIEEIVECLKNRKSVMNFVTTKIQKKKLN